jgi:hypothetical protein
LRVASEAVLRVGDGDIVAAEAGVFEEELDGEFEGAGRFGFEGSEVEDLGAGLANDGTRLSVFVIRRRFGDSKINATDAAEVFAGLGDEGSIGAPGPGDDDMIVTASDDCGAGDERGELVVGPCEPWWVTRMTMQPSSESF